VSRCRQTINVLPGR